MVRTYIKTLHRVVDGYRWNCAVPHHAPGTYAHSFSFDMLAPDKQADLAQNANSVITDIWQDGSMLSAFPTNIATDLGRTLVVAHRDYTELGFLVTEHVNNNERAYIYMNALKNDRIATRAGANIMDHVKLSKKQNIGMPNDAKENTWELEVEVPAQTIVRAIEYMHLNKPALSPGEELLTEYFWNQLCQTMTCHDINSAAEVMAKYAAQLSPAGAALTFLGGMVNGSSNVSVTLSHDEEGDNSTTVHVNRTLEALEESTIRIVDRISAAGTMPWSDVRQPMDITQFLWRIALDQFTNLSLRTD